MMIDIFCHIMPQKYADHLCKKIPAASNLINAVPTLVDLDIRFRIMDRYQVVQVLSLGAPAVENVGSPQAAEELARMANDEMAELINKYPDRFAAAIACLPMNNIDAALKEIDRTVKELGFRGVQIYSDINGKPLDSPEFLPIYEKMAYYNLPILLHPQIRTKVPVHTAEKEPKYLVSDVFGWPYLTTVAMSYLVGGGVFSKYPNLKVIAHHCGAMVPYFGNRISFERDFAEMRMRNRTGEYPARDIVELYRMFYADTAVQGNITALMCGYDFFGADHLLFGTDMPYDSQIGDRSTKQTILSVERMNIPDSDKRKIFEDNARKLLRLPI